MRSYLHKHSGFAVIEITLGVLLLLVLGLGWWKLSEGSITTVVPSPSPSSAPTAITPSPIGLTPIITQPTSVPRLLAFLRDDSVHTIDIDTLVENNLDYPVQSGSGAVGWGNSGIIQSPDLRFIAYTSVSEFVHVVDLETQEAGPFANWPIEDTFWGINSYLTGWSPDSTKLLYYLESSNMCIDCSPEVYEGMEDNPNVEFGFYVYDAIQKSTEHVPGLAEEVLGWHSDSDKVYVEISNGPGSVNEPFLGLFNFATGETTQVEGFQFLYFPGQVYVSETLPIIVYGQSPASDVPGSSFDGTNLILHNLDTDTETLIREGSFTANFRPRINPSNEYVVFQDKTQTKVFRYNIGTQETDELFQTTGLIRHWLSDYEAIFTIEIDGEVLYVLDIRTGELRELTNNATLTSSY